MTIAGGPKAADALSWRRRVRHLAEPFVSLLPRRFRPRLSIVELVRRRTRMIVPAGPFAGMQLEPTWPDLPEILGIYERELWDVIAGLRNIQISKIVNVGSARGYYTVGLARMLPKATVIAFEMDEDRQAVMRRVSILNHVQERVVSRGRCDPEGLAAAVGKGEACFVICDVEGYERTLMDPVAVPGLGNSFILLELHEIYEPGITELIRRRFGESHEIVEIWQTDRSAGDFPYTDWFTRLLPGRYKLWAVEEGRNTRMNWFWMVPKDQAAR